jgi:peptidoglycan hydrolase CwlO-like protein
MSEYPLIFDDIQSSLEGEQAFKNEGNHIPKNQEKEGIEMRRFGILITLLCLTLVVPGVALSASPKSEKGDYQKQIETKLKEFRQKLEELKGKATELKEDAKAEFNEQMKELQKKEKAANQKLKELKSAGSKTWDKLKAQMDAAMDELNKEYEKVMSRFKKT